MEYLVQHQNQVVKIIFLRPYLGFGMTGNYRSKNDAKITASSKIRQSP